MIQHIHHVSASTKNLPGASLVGATTGCDIMPPRTGKDCRRTGEDQRGIEEEGASRRKKPRRRRHAGALGRAEDWVLYLFGLGQACVFGLMGCQKNSTLQAIPF